MLFKKTPAQVMRDQVGKYATKEIHKTIDKKRPIIIGVLTAVLTAYTIFESNKPATTSVTIINNYYFYGGIK